MLIRKTLSTLVVAAMSLSLSPLAGAADKPADTAASPRGTVKGGSDYEQTMKQSGMSGMSGMSGDHSMTAKPPEKKAAKAKKKKKKAAPKA